MGKAENPEGISQQSPGLIEDLPWGIDQKNLTTSTRLRKKRVNPNRPLRHRNS
jgi:hypothetical protein